MIRIGIVGCGRILNAHLQGYQRLREKGVDSFRITALCARREEDALMFRRRGEGPTPRPPVLDPATGDPLAAPHTYLSDFQDHVEAQI
jgi:predicted dehydrogenase